jgi:hypothetical protein
MEPARPSRRSLALLLAACLAVVALSSGCGGDGETTAAPTTASPSERPQPAKPEPRPDSVASSHCPPELPTCLTTSGRIVYVERVDPDGDGDAHFVILDPQGVTLPGITAIDLRKGLRPHPLPEYGDLISAAGPVQTGSHGQSQIPALEFHVAGR